MWGDSVVTIPPVLHLYICEENLELISSRSHIHVARSEDHHRNGSGGSLCVPARFASGDKGTLGIFLLFPLSFLLFSSFSSFFYVNGLRKYSERKIGRVNPVWREHTPLWHITLSKCLFYITSQLTSPRRAQALVSKAGVSKDILWFEWASYTISCDQTVKTEKKVFLLYSWPKWVVGWSHHL